MKRWVCISVSSDGNFVATGGQIGRRPGERGTFDLGENIRMLTSSKVKPGEADKFVNEEERIEVRRKERGSYRGKEQRLFGS